MFSTLSVEFPMLTVFPLDTLFNHMTGQSNGTGVGGTQFTQYSYPGVWTEDNFHYCDTPNHEIESWDNLEQVWFCQLEGLAE